MPGFAQDFNHPWFHGHYNQVKHTPDYVIWDLSIDHIQCANPTPRTNRFLVDPAVKDVDLNKDYAKSGFDQGHVDAAQDNSCNPQREAECFYFSNMVPQVPNLNRGTYKAWEEWTRHEVTVKGVTLHIVGGPLGVLQAFGPHHVVAPQFSWVAVRENGQWSCWIFPNQPDVNRFSFVHYAVSLSTLDQQTGLKIEDLK